MNSTNEENNFDETTDENDVSNEEFAIDYEGLEEEIEQNLSECYGPPDARAAKNASYVAALVAIYSEPLIRKILAALALVPNFIPAEDLTEAMTAPLETMIRPYAYPFFQFERIELEGDRLTVEVYHGASRMSRGDEFLFQIENEKLSLIAETFTRMS